MAEGQKGGVSIGSVGSVAGDIVGGDKIGGDKYVGGPSPEALEAVLGPLMEAIRAAPPDAQAAAAAKVATLKDEAAKGKDADDSVIAKLIDGLVALVPGAASAVVGAFGTPILGALAGPTTKFVLDKLMGK